MFAQELAIHGNCSAAYRRTYPVASDATVKSNASVLAKKPDVARRIAELQKARREQLLRDTEDLELLVGNMALGKGAQLIDENGKPVPIHELPEEVKVAIAGLDVELDDEGKVRKYKIKFPDPLAAARLLAQLRGQLIERKDLTSGGKSLEPIITPDALTPEQQRELNRRLYGREVIEGELADPDDVSDLL